MASLNPDLSDQSFNYFMNALFWPINMVDYEEDLHGEAWSNYEMPGG